MGMMDTFFQEMGSADITEKKRMEGRGCSAKSKSWNKENAVNLGRTVFWSWWLSEGYGRLSGSDGCICVVRVTDGNDFERLGRTPDLQQQMRDQTDQQTKHETSAEVGAQYLAQAWQTVVLQSISCYTLMAGKSRAEKICTILSPKRKSTCHHYIRRWSILDGVSQRYSWRYLFLQDTAKKADAFLQPQSNT